MSARPWLASTLGVVLAAVVVVLPACSSNDPQDMNINTDVGVGFLPPDGARVTGPADAASDAAVNDGADASPDSADAADASPDSAGPEGPGAGPEGPGIDGSNHDVHDGQDG